MKLETYTLNNKEVVVESKKLLVTVYTWGNLEGASLMVERNDAAGGLLMSGSFRWEELDAIIAALAAARAV